jgi:putative inorganic carbon (HCO3(-)) transporter
LSINVNLRSKVSFTYIYSLLIIFLFVFIPYRELLSYFISTNIKFIPDILIIGFFLYDVFINKKYKKINYIDIYYLLFLTIAFIGSYSNTGIKAFFVQSRSIALYYLIYVISRDKTFENNFYVTVKKALKINTVILMIFAIIEKIFSKWYLFPKEWADSIPYADNFRRVYSFFDNPNTFGAYLVLTFLFCIYLELNEKKVDIYFHSLLILGIMLTGSRSSTMALFIIIIIEIIYEFKLRVHRKPTLIMTILIIICLSSVFNIILSSASQSIAANSSSNVTMANKSNVLLDRFDEMTNNKIITKSTTNGRVYSIKTGFKIYINYPLFGSGFGSYGDAASLILGSPIYKQYSIRNNFYADNEYIKVLVENGTIGFISYTLFLLMLLKMVLKSKNILKVIMFITICFLGLFYNVFEVQIISMFFWFTLGTTKFDENNKKVILH